MKFLMLFLLCTQAFAINDEELRQHWLGRVQIAERHPGYQDGESLRAPGGTWQTLFTVILSEEKHCVHGHIPVKGQAGELKIVSIKLNESCANSWEKSSLWERQKLRSIQFVANNEEIKLWWSDSEGRVHSLSSKIPLIKGVFFYPPNISESAVKVPLVGQLQDVYPTNPCRLEDGSCQLCRYGVYRVQNATPEYYCGIDHCGETNMPACLRGTRWQKSRGPFTCRTNNDHVFCAEGLRVECLGEVAFCR